MKNEPLFDLINALTMSEKRFFKIFSQRHVIGEKNQYLLMFDFIDKSKTINNEILLEQPFSKNLSAEKNYLYRLILKSLNAYYYEFSSKMKVQNLINNAEILAYKGLEYQALNILDKAKTIAEIAELFTHSLTIEQTKFEILSKLTKYDDANIHLEFTQVELEKFKALLSVQKLATQAYSARQKQGAIRSKDELIALNKLIATQQKKGYDSLKTTLFQNSLNITQAHASKEFKKEIDLLHRIIALYENNQFLMEYSIKGYISSVYNLANTYRNLKDYRKVLKVLQKLEDLKNNKLITNSKSLSAYIFFLSNSLKLLIYILNQDINLAYKLYLTIKKEYNQHTKSIDKSVVYEHYILLTSILIRTNEYKEALKFSNLIINDTTYKNRADILSFIRLLNLVIHFELKNDLIIDSLSSAAKSYLKKRKRLFKTEYEVISFIQKYGIVEKAKLIKINERLVLLKAEPIEKIMFNVFDFQEWLESKIK